MSEDKKLSVLENKKAGNMKTKKKLHDHHNNVSSRLQWNAAGRIVKENAPRRTDSLYSVNPRPMYLLPLVQCGCLLCVCPDSERNYIKSTELLTEFGYSTLDTFR